jgi:glutamyl-tRNA reductase
LEPALLVIGLNHHTAPADIRARFAMDATQRSAALRDLSQSDGVEEALILSTEDHTEFLLWAGDPAAAASSVLQLLSQHYELKLCEWRHFFRLLHEDALVHCFRVASGLDSLPGDAAQSPQLEEAWNEAREVRAAGSYLEAVVQQALAVARRVREITFAAPANAASPESAASGSPREAQNLIAAEARACHRELETRHLVPAIASLRNRLEEICRNEIDSFGQDAGPFPHEQRELLTAFAPRIAQKIAGSLAREIKATHSIAELSEEMSRAAAKNSRVS